MRKLASFQIGDGSGNKENRDFPLITGKLLSSQRIGNSSISNKGKTRIITANIHDSNSHSTPYIINNLATFAVP